MPGLTLSEAARVWGVHRDTVKRWVETKSVEAIKDNQGVWRIADGQQPPPSAYRLRGIAGAFQEDPKQGADGALQGQSEGADSAIAGAPQGSAGVTTVMRLEELTAALATAEKGWAVSQREVELLRERIADLQEQHRERIGELREELAASKADRERLLALVETQARALVDLRERPPVAATEGLVVRIRRWLLGDRGLPLAASQGTGDASGSP